MQPSTKPSFCARLQAFVSFYSLGIGRFEVKLTQSQDDSMEALMGAAAFIAIKFFGYRYAGKLLNSRYEVSVPLNHFGALRTFLGVLFGIAAFAVANSFELTRGAPSTYAMLFPVRVIEWSLAIYLFYEHKQEKIDFRRFFSFALIGSTWSYILDLPAAMSLFVIPRSFWVC